MGADNSKDKPTHQVFVYTGDKKGGSVRNITVSYQSLLFQVK